MRHLLLLCLAIPPVAPLTGATIPIQHGIQSRQSEARPGPSIGRSPGWMFMDLCKQGALLPEASGILTPGAATWAGAQTAGQEFHRGWRPDLKQFFSATLGTIRPLIQHEKLDLDKFNLDFGR